MIIYDHKSTGLRKLFVVDGSVFPSSVAVAVPCGLLAVGLRVWMDSGGDVGDWLPTDEITEVWSGFTFLMGFLIVFRTSQAYNRFWDGCAATHNMRAEWLDCVSALCSFIQFSDGRVATEKQEIFKAKLIRLVSMLHSAALAELEVMGLDFPHHKEVASFRYELIDPAGLDETSLRLLQQSNTKVQLLYGWIQCLIVKNISEGVLSIPPPLLGRAIQELSNGMVAFHQAMKISQIPFPFPYTQTCDCLLFLHFLITPIVTCQSVTSPLWAGVFVFVQVFVLWALNFTAIEIENPFGVDPNDLDGRTMQMSMNQCLLLMMRSSSTRIPELSADYVTNQTAEKGDFTLQSFHDVWCDSPELTTLPSSVGTDDFNVDASHPSIKRRSGSAARSFLSLFARSSVRKNPEESRWYRQQKEEVALNARQCHTQPGQNGPGAQAQSAQVDTRTLDGIDAPVPSHARAGHLHSVVSDSDIVRSLLHILQQNRSHHPAAQADDNHSLRSSSHGVLQSSSASELQLCLSSLNHHDDGSLRDAPTHSASKAEHLPAEQIHQSHAVTGSEGGMLPPSPPRVMGL